MVVMPARKGSPVRSQYRPRTNPFASQGDSLFVREAMPQFVPQTEGRTQACDTPDGRPLDK